jgi:hypothetical protein
VKGKKECAHAVVCSQHNTGAEHRCVPVRGCTINPYSTVRKSEGQTSLLGDQGTHARILKWILKTGCEDADRNQVTRPCEHDNEHFGSIKDKKCLNELRNNY